LITSVRIGWKIVALARLQVKIVVIVPVATKKRVNISYIQLIFSFRYSIIKISVIFKVSAGILLVTFM
jgi:hypothetical protein